MDNPSEKHTYDKWLPSPYMNPWASLVRSLREVLSDIYLRSRELLRLNQHGLLSTPSFLPTSLKSYFWPFFLITLFVIPIFMIIPVGHSIAVDRPVLEANTELASSSTKLKFDNALTNQNDLNEISTKNTNSFIKEDLGNSFPKSSSDLIIISILDQYNAAQVIDSNLFHIVDSSSLNNGVLIKAEPQWSILPYSEKIELLESLYNHLHTIGFEQLEVVDEHGLRIARNSRIGNGITFFEQNSS